MIFDRYGASPLADARVVPSEIRLIRLWDAAVAGEAEGLSIGDEALRFCRFQYGESGKPFLAEYTAAVFVTLCRFTVPGGIGPRSGISCLGRRVPGGLVFEPRREELC